MAAPQTVEEFVESLSSVDLLSAADLETIRTDAGKRQPKPSVETLAGELVQAGKLTKFQATAVCAGKTRAIHCGEYLLLDKIGAGGMGQVFKARHRRMKRIVAVKLLTPRSKGHDQAIKRFYQEVELAGRLVHPNIVTAYDAGEANSLHYLVMEFVDGQDLSSTLKPNKKLPVEEAIDAVQQAARGLQYAHAQGIVHRDIKPSNLLRDTQGNIKILDMGLARSSAALAEGDDHKEGLTQSGEVMGTVDYMAPEQARNTREADGRADIYSLGCTIYRLVTGTVPFTGDSLLAKIMAHCEQPIPPMSAKVPGIDPRLDSLYQRMIAKRPEDRPSLSEIIAELEACKTEQKLPSPAKPPSAAERANQTAAQGSSVKLSELPNLPGQSGIGSSLAGPALPSPGGSVIGREAPATGPGASAAKQGAAPAPARRPAPREKEPAPAAPPVEPPAQAGMPIVTTSTPAVSPATSANQAGKANQPGKNADTMSPQMRTAMMVGGGAVLLLVLALGAALIYALTRPAAEPEVVVDKPATPTKPAKVEPKPATPVTPTPAPMTPTIIEMPMTPPDIMPPVIPPPINPEPMLRLPEPMAEPTAPAPTPMIAPPVAAPKPTRMNARMNLLTLVDVPRDSIEGVWTRLEAGLNSSSAASMNRIQFPHSPLGEYELRATYSARAVGGHFSLGLPTEGGKTILLVDRSVSREYAGLNFKGAPYNNNRTTNRQLPDLNDTAPYTIVCRVRPDHITVSMQGKPAIDWRGVVAELEAPVSRGGPDPTKFSIQTSALDFTFSRLEVIPLGMTPAPVPEGEALTTATAKADELAGSALPAGAGAQRKIAEANRLHLMAATLEDSAAAYVLLQRAIDLAVAADDAILACDLAEDIGRHYEEDSLATVRKTLAKIAALPKTQNERLDSARQALLYAEVQSRWENYDQALELIQWSATQYTKAKDLDQAREAKIREAECKESKTLYVAMLAAREKLAADPEHGESNAAVGDYLVAARDSFAPALPYLAKSHATEMRAAAQLEQNSAIDPNKTGAIGEAWVAAAETVAGPAKTVYFQHAREWLERGVNGVAGPNLKKITARIARDEQDSRRLTGGVFLKRHPLDAIYFNGHWYKLYLTSDSWWGARRKCRDLGGDLTCVETPAEHQFLSQFAVSQFGKPDRMHIWIGASEEGHEGVFLWVTGAPLQFSAWATNYPNKNLTGGAIRMTRDGQGSPRFTWMDNAPGDGYFFICEWDR